MIAAEVASALDMQKSSAHKHLTRLAAAGFVNRHDDEARVWVYYSLTTAGRHLVENERPRLVLLLSASLASLGALVGFVAWRVEEYVRAYPPGSWGVGHIHKPPSFFTPGVLAAIALVIIALGASVHLAARMRRVRRQG